MDNPFPREAMPFVYGIFGGSLILAVGLAYLLAHWLTGWSRNWALRHGIVSHVSHRSSHTIPTARLGGVGLALGFIIASILYLLVIHFAFGRPENIRLFWIGAGCLLIFVVGLLDDVYDLPPLVKLGLSIFAVLIPVVGGRVAFHYLDALFLPSSFVYLLNAGLSAFWLLFFLNAYNFMDGMDGFAAGFARLAAAFLFILFVHLDETTSAGQGLEFLLLPILAGACWGFLAWNNPPAKVFMGDGGSLSVGYLLAIYVLLGSADFDSRNHGPADAPAILFTLSALTILLPFIFDVVLTLIRRSLRGENILKAHREHLYQRLMKTGLSHGEVLRLTKKRFWACGVAAILGALPAHPAARWAAFVFALGVMVHYWRLTLARERALSVQSVENK